MHLAVNINTKEIIALDITKEDTHDSKRFKDIIDSIPNKIDRVYADKAYDSNDNFNHLIDKNIEPVIRVRDNSIIDDSIRGMYVSEQLNDYTRWKYKYYYNKRWIIESVYSSFKRIFRHIKSVKWENIIKELMIKVNVYNLFMAISNGLR